MAQMVAVLMAKAGAWLCYCVYDGCPQLDLHVVVVVAAGVVVVVVHHVAGSALSGML